MSTIWYVHGAGASETSFAWLRRELPDHEAKFFSYDANETVESCIARLSDAIANEQQSVVLIGHSLGGVISRACASFSNVSHLVTICAPFGGLMYADLFSLFFGTPMFSALRKYSSILLDIRTRRIVAPHLAIVGSRGLPHICQPNDGVVTLESQTAIRNLDYKHVDLNHFEVLLSSTVADHVNRFIMPFDARRASLLEL